MAYFERVLFPLDKEGKGWMGGCDDIGNLNVTICTRLAKSKEMEVKHLHITCILTYIK